MKEKYRQYPLRTLMQSPQQKTSKLNVTAYKKDDILCQSVEAIQGSTNRYTDKQKEVYKYNRTHINLKKVGKPDIWYTMSES